jgi:hypothetical protein
MRAPQQVTPLSAVPPSSGPLLTETSCALPSAALLKEAPSAVGLVNVLEIVPEGKHYP